MYQLLAQAETANQERSLQQILLLVHSLLTNPVFICILFAMGVATISVVMKHRFMLRKAEIDATLKQEMIQRGMSADEIERVLAARSNLGPNQSNSPSTETAAYPAGQQKT